MNKRIVASTLAAVVLAAGAVAGLALVHHHTQTAPVVVVMDHTKLEQSFHQHMLDRGYTVEINCYADVVRANGAGSYVCRGELTHDANNGALAYIEPVQTTHVVVDDSGRWISTGGTMG